VTQAYARDPLLQRQRIFIQAEHGMVYLSGYVTSPDIRDALEKIAAALPRVRAVVNEILAPGADSVQILRALDIGVGQAVQATEMQIGQVERMIVSPQQRSVAAFIAHGALPDLARATPRMLPDTMPKHERQVIVPISAVREVTGEGVELRVSGLEAARYSDFEPANFVAPDATWSPPHAYQAADVLLDLGCAEASRRDLRPVRDGQALMVRSGLGGMVVWEYISQGMPVHCHAGLAGTVDHVRVDSYLGTVSQIVVYTGALLPKDTLIPLDWVRRIDATGVFVDVGAEQLAALPEADRARGEGVKR